MVAVGVTLCVPLVALVPVHPLDAEHDVALVDDQVSVEVAPAMIDVGEAVNVTVGIGAGVTPIVADEVAVPPAPVHAKVYVVVAVGVTPCVPLIALLPVQPPEAVHAVALVDDQVSVEVAPAIIDVGEAEKVTVGIGAGVTDTVADWDALPPAPVHVSVYVVVAVGATLCVPLTALVPVQPPEAVHAVALVLLQVSVEDAPDVIDRGDADKVTVGAGAAVTVTVVCCEADPPAPVQVSAYVVVVAGVTASVPLTALLPVHPLDAVHDVALVDDQVSVEVAPAMIDVGEAAMVTVGAGAGVTDTVADEVAVPPAPVHASVYVVVAVGVTPCVPLIALLPVQPPEAVHAVALADDQVSVEVAPETTDVGEADNVTVGTGGGPEETVTAACCTTDPPAPVQVSVYVVVVAGDTDKVPAYCLITGPAA